MPGKASRDPSEGSLGSVLGIEKDSIKLKNEGMLQWLVLFAVGSSGVAEI